MVDHPRSDKRWSKDGITVYLNRNIIVEIIEITF